VGERERGGCLCIGVRGGILLVPPERGRERESACVCEEVWERERGWGGGVCVLM